MAENEAGQKKSERVVSIVDGPDHGYIGTVQDDHPNEAYTVAGVTKGAAPAEDRSAAQETPAASHGKETKK